jgi:formylmethanofuran dehydrogenase subunit C
MALLLTYRAETNVPIEVEGLLPATLAHLSRAEIEKLPIWHGNQQQPLAEFFTVSGDPSDNRLELAGNLSGVHRIGARMTAGEIHVQGNVGRHLGTEMHGGTIHVNGDAGDWVGAEMKAGLIHVCGSAGDQVASAYHGSPKGMTGGNVLIDGNIGHEAARAMRRGLLAVGGDCGDFAALNMFAGSLLVFGRCGARPAAGMNRGTVAIFGQAPPLLPTFALAGPCQPPFMPIYLRQLRDWGFAIPAEMFDSEFLLYHGDLVATGRGEILIRR